MSSWRDEQNGIPPWNERPKCHCGFHAWLQVWEDRVPRGKKAYRYFKCPTIDDDFKACTFMEWIDTRPLEEVGIILVVLETKAQYYGRLEAAQDVKEEFKARQAQLLQKEEQQKKMNKQEAECSSKTARKGKLPQFTQ
uniref:Zinc finger GRF-type domain-containing protein n=1 Tax=Setaria viridis TaxID=4556 RepID=A0A4U6T2M3_SETVI|nr:hypothetical protein SEVIR_9G329300v2 [Setaria viridis]